MKTLSYPPQLKIACLPTAMYPLRRLSEAWGGPTIWVKRDDQTGAVLSGNKIRKLQFAIHEAIDQGCDTLVACGGVQSNFCRATAALARRQGLDVELFLRGTEPPRSEGNLLLDQLFGATIQYITPKQYQDRDALMDAYADQLRATGRAPYVLAEGCSMPIGVWGYVEAAEEITRQAQAHGVHFEAWVHPIGSGGTTAGLELGRQLLNETSEVLAFAVCDDTATHTQTVKRLIDETCHRWEIQSHPLAMTIDDSQVGEGYGIASPAVWQTIVEAAQTEGLVFDPVYTGKAVHGLKCAVQAGRWTAEQHVLLIHTGGIFGLFPQADKLPRDG